MSSIEAPLTTTAQPDRVVYAVDSEHSGLRLAVLLTFIGLAIVIFIVTNAIIGGGLAILPLLIAFAIAYGVTLLVERVLKQRWTSGRTVMVSDDGVNLVNKGTAEATVLSEDPARMVCWRFVVAKRTRVPKGWSMFACAIQIDGTTLAAYTFLSPDRADQFPRRDRFKLLEPTRKGALNSDERQDLRLAGEQRRLRDAENLRWIGGAEMTPDDFTAYCDQIADRFPQWIPTP